MCINVKSGVEILLFLFNIFQVALDIIQNDEDPKSKNVEEYRKRNYWPKWKRLCIQNYNYNKTRSFGPIA